MIEHALAKKDISKLPVLCVMKERFRNRVDNTTHAEWLAISEPNRKNVVTLKKHDALQLINLLAMERVVSNENGDIYDTANGNYLKKYKGFKVNI